MCVMRPQVAAALLFAGVGVSRWRTFNLPLLIRKDGPRKRTGGFVDENTETQYLSKLILITSAKFQIEQLYLDFNNIRIHLVLYSREYLLQKIRRNH